jgi:hypothetical protein
MKPAYHRKTCLQHIIKKIINKHNKVTVCLRQILKHFYHFSAVVHRLSLTKRSFMNQGQGQSGLLDCLVHRINMSKYEENPFRYKLEMCP